MSDDVLVMTYQMLPLCVGMLLDITSSEIRRTKRVALAHVHVLGERTIFLPWRDLRQRDKYIYNMQQQNTHTIWIKWPIFVTIPRNLSMLG